MPKNIEDIIPTNRKSIRSIPVPVRRAEKVREPEPELPEVKIREPKKRSSRRNIFLAGAVGIVLVLFAVIAVQSGATLAYTPKTAELNFEDELFAAKQAAAAEELPYSVIKLSGDKSVTVVATAEETVSEKASGRVVIYNEQTVSQQLIKTTRLETTDGKIYRIQEDISIPAKGNIEVTAVADQPGVSYNIPLSDFTIPGLKGSAKYSLVYARSKTPMSGGFTGTRKKVNETELASARASLEGTLKSELLGQAKAQMPSDFILFPGLAEITYEVLPIESAGDTSAKITIRGSINAAIFKQDDLANYLARNKLGKEKLDAPVAIPNLSALNVMLDESQAPGIAKVDNLKIRISGVVVAEYLTDEVALATDLAGADKDEVDAILKAYPSIDTASVTIRPLWSSSFPNEASKIKIERKN